MSRAALPTPDGRRSPSAVAGAAAALLMAAPARANIVFDFSGVCNFTCTGTSTGVLTLADAYTFGSNITAADFISFDYSSSTGSFDITSADDPSVNPGTTSGLNADGSIAGEILFQAPAPDFAFFDVVSGFF
jgi:hypothetical protein